MKLTVQADFSIYRPATYLLLTSFGSFRLLPGWKSGPHQIRGDPSGGHGIKQYLDVPKNMTENSTTKYLF